MPHPHRPGPSRRGLVGLTVILTALFATLPAMFVPGQAAHAGEDEPNGSMVLVLDASGSMKESHGDGRTRFRAATDALHKVVRSLPSDLHVGLRVYGSQISDGPGSCKDSELVVPVDEVDEQALHRALDRARPLGNTPIAYSLRQAAQDLPDEGSRTIVLVSDGEESCGGDPCRVARDLSERGLDLHVDVVGFQVDNAARNQLTCIAQAGRGTFYDAPDAEALVTQLSRLSQRAARDYLPAGIPVEGADTAEDAPALDAGQYLDTLGDGSPTETYLLEPQPGHTLHVSATVRPTTQTLSDSEAVEVSVAAVDGTECMSQRNSSQGAFDELTPLTTRLSVAGEELADCGVAPYSLQVTGDSGNVKPLEVMVVAEPPVRDAQSLPAPVEGGYDVENTQSGAAVRAVGSPGFSAAPVLEPGVYEDAILDGETLYYAAEVGWGQQLVCDITFRGSPAADQAIEQATPNGEVVMHGPLRDQFFSTDFSDTESLDFDGARDVTVHYASPPVRYLNREAGYGITPASLPGTYFCGARLRGIGDYEGLGEVPFQISIDVVGTAGEGAPEYVEDTSSETASPSAAPADDGTDQQADDPADGADEGGLALWPWLLAAVIVVLAAAFVLLNRRTRRTG